MKNEKSTMFVVVGMHRSGSSAMARGLLPLGIGLGDNLLNPSESENPKGYWEDVDLMFLSEKVLASLGRQWESVTPLLERDFSSAENSDLVEEAATLISKKMAGSRNWGFKNPRTGPLIPFWRRVFQALGIDVKYLVTVRNPINVARSLAVRDHFSPGYSYALWTSYYLDTLRNLKGENSAFIAYENLMTRPEHELRRVAEILDITWDDGVASSVQDYAENFISDDLTHHHLNISDLKADASSFSQTLDLYDVLNLLCEETEPTWSLDMDAAIVKTTRSWRRQGRLLTIVEQQETGFEQRIAQHKSEIQSHHHHLSVQESVIAEMREEAAQGVGKQAAQENELEALRQDGVKKNQLHREHEAIIAEMHEAAARGAEKLVVQENELKALRQDSINKDRLYTAAQSKITDLAEAAAQQHAAIAALEETLAVARADAETMKSELAEIENKNYDLSSKLESTNNALATLGREKTTLELKFREHVDQAVQTEARLHDLLKIGDQVALSLKANLRDLGEDHAGQLDKERNLHGVIAALNGDRNKLEGIFERYEGAVASLLESSRWRTGNAIGEFRRGLLRQPEVPMATHFLKDLSLQFHDWKDRDKTTDPEQGLQVNGGEVRILSGARTAALSNRFMEIGNDAHVDAARIAAAYTGLANAPPITIIVPIYNAIDDVQHCLSSLVRNTTSKATLCLIDDASPDPEISKLLRRYENFANVEILVNEKNLGFTGTVNRGMTHASGDVVLLNSDTVVGPRWLENLRLAAYSDAGVGTVTAISDNAGAFSCPIPGEKNRTPAALFDDDVARLVFQESVRVYPDVPTGNGFCLYIKRPVIEKIGLLDIENFPRGYGEENDFCLRAMNAGFHHLIDDSTYVFHREGSSFEGARSDLMKTGGATINRLYPQYDRLVAVAFTAPPLARAREAARIAFESTASLTGNVRPRVLYLVHQTEGGMTQTVIDLIHGLDDCYHAFILMSDGENLSLLEYENRTMRTIEQIKLAQPIFDCRLPHPEYGQILARVLQEYRIELAHMHHLLSSTLDVCSVLETFDIPLVLSIHDYFYICPTVNLLDQDDAYCGGHCTIGDGQCPVPFQYFASIPGLKHGWIYDWRIQTSRLLRAADSIVAPSQYVLDLYRSHFPDLNAQKICVIEHGRDLEYDGDCATPPTSDEIVRVLVPGVISRHKGAQLIQKLAKLDGGKRLEFHFLGRIPPQLEGIGIEHGLYEVTELQSHVRAIAPSFIGLFSITSETYGHVLTEAWSCGVPALVLDIGAQADRIALHGGGWVLDPRNVGAAYRQILAISDDADAYAAQLEKATLKDVPTLDDMGHDYDRLYRHVRFERRAFTPRGAAGSSARMGDAVFPLRLAVIPQMDGDGQPISSAFIRLKSPLDHSLSRNLLDYREVALSEFLDRCSEFDAAIVQRMALPGDKAGRFVTACRDGNIPYVFDVDDDLLALDESHIEAAVYARDRPGLRSLVENAALVLTSTSVIAERYNAFNDNVALVPNALDEKTWFASKDHNTQRDRDYEGIGLLYMGTETHADDLIVLKQALENLASIHKAPDVRLFVIGGEPKNTAPDWYTRINAPLDCRRYPEFVDWLRSYRNFWDIALAPLAETPFNEAKSHLKYLEYTALGLPGVYADLAPYNRVVAPNRTGLLAAHTPEAWADAIRTLADSEDLRMEIAAAAHEDLVENHLLGHTAGNFAGAVVSAIRR
jgi:O-antigen biosynthesis protein